jgi:predicted nucleotide-binding protein
MGLIDRFKGDRGEKLLVESLTSLKLVAGNHTLAAEMGAKVQLQALAAGDLLIEQNGSDNDVFFILAGSLDVIVNGRKVGVRGPGDHVGEMAAIQPSQLRSASIVAAEEAVVARLTEADLTALATAHPEIWRLIARELANRLLQRNAYVGAYRDKIRVFIISSAEALSIARTIQNAFECDPFHVSIWTDGVFKVANYTLQSLEDEVNNSDFAIAIAHADDVTDSRETQWPSPRDNVIFELGLFMGRLGRTRAILMEPRGEKVKLPSDLAGITTIPYQFEKGKDAAAMMAPACNRLREHILANGAYNG